MFSQMNQVGKEQAVQKEIPLQAQIAQGAEIVKKTGQQDSSVNQTHDLGKGLEKVNEEKEQEQRASSKEKREKKETPEEKEYFEDPDLGHHIDIVG
jgi:hypothetical protein